MRVALSLLALFLLPGALSAEPEIRILPAGECVQQDTITMERPALEEFVRCLQQRKACLAEMEQLPVEIHPPAQVHEGLPWWVIPVSGASGLLAGLLGGWALTR